MNMKKEIMFRSGLSTKNDLETFRIAGQDVGTSLYVFRKDKLTDPFPMSLQATINDHQPLFVDNGLIGHKSANTPFVPADALARYKEIVDSYQNTKFLTLVVPDDPFDENNALNTIKEHKEVIKYLLKRARVMIPIHRTHTRTLTEQALLISKALNHTKFTLGIPCKTENGWRLEEAEIIELLSIKRGNGKALFTDVHFLGLGETSLGDKEKGGAYPLRKRICEHFGVTFSSDVTRIRAMVGNEGVTSTGKKKSLKIATKNARDYLERMTRIREHAREFLCSESYFKTLDYETEVDAPMLHDFFFYECTNEDQYHIFNQAFPAMKFTDGEADYNNAEWPETLFEIMSMAGGSWEEELKKVFFTSTENTMEVQYSIQPPRPSNKEIRRAGFIECYIEKEAKHLWTPLQSDLFIEAELSQQSI